MDERASVSMAVVEAVSEAEGVDPMALAQPLADVVDPDALDALFRDGNGRVVIDYCGYEVTVHADRNVDVTPLERA